MNSDSGAATATKIPTEQFARETFGYAAQLLSGGANRQKVEAALLERGLDTSSSAMVLDNLLEARAKALKDAGLKDILKGSLWCIGGIVATAMTYAAASSGDGGGTYVVAWGAVVFGGYQALRGVVLFVRGTVGKAW